METLGVYLQAPFCASKCSFCNFSSRVAPHDVYDRYCRALLDEIERLPDLYRAAGADFDLLTAPVDSIYIGGGTPSLLGGDRLEMIAERLRRRFEFAPTVEFTLEVTPGSADKMFLSRILALGINRLSIGAQSFADVELRAVGRLHSAEDTQTLIDIARGSGFANISLDLIAGLPYQSASSWAASLESAIALQPEHVSIYLFEIDEKSRLGNEILRHGTRYHSSMMPDDDFMADAYDSARKILTVHGFAHYEISNFAQPGFESTHNRKYWQMKPYIGLGAGAHSFDGNSRWSNAVQVEEYEGSLQRGGSPICDHHTLSQGARMEEFFFLGLRQRIGVDLADAQQHLGQMLEHRWVEKIKSLEKDGWLECVEGRIRLTENALLVSNEIFQEFIGA